MKFIMGKEKDMKSSQRMIEARAKTTFVDVWYWGQELERLHARMVLSELGTQKHIKVQRMLTTTRLLAMRRAVLARLQADRGTFVVVRRVR